MAGAGGSGGSPRRDALLALLGTALLAGIFWAIFLAQTAESPLTRAPQLDEAYYLREAARLRSVGGPGDRPAVMSPGYPVLVAIGGGQAPVAGVLERHPAGLLAVQALAWFAGAVLIGGVVRGAGLRAGLAPRRALLVGLAAALLFLLYRPAAIYARTVLLDLPLAVLVTGALAAGLAVRPGVVARAILSGLCLGLAASLRAHVLVLLVLLLPVILRRAAGRPGRWSAAVVLLVLSVLPVALASWHNTRVTGRLAGPSLNAGINLYLGQLPGAQGLFTSLAGLDFEHDPAGVDYLARRTGEIVRGPGEADRRWRAEAARIVAEDPGRALLGWIRKLWLHLQGWEIAQVTPLGAWPSEAPVLRALPVPWALLVVLGLVGGVAALAAGPGRATPPGRSVAGEARVWLLAVLLLVAVQGMFFVVSRYRLVIAPPLAVLAGLGLVALLAPAPASAGRWRRLAPVVALPVAVLLVVPWGLGELRREWDGLQDLNLARRLLVLDRPGAAERADELLAAACARSPRRGPPWQLRASNLARLGRADAALVCLAEGILSVEEPAALERGRIALLRELGRLDEAEALSRAYLRDRPGDLDVLHDLAVLQGSRGRWAGAAATAERLRDLAPRDHRGWLDLAVAQARLGRRDQATATLRAGLAQVPAGPGRDLLAENLRRLTEAQTRPEGP